MGATGQRRSGTVRMDDNRKWGSMERRTAPKGEGVREKWEKMDKGRKQIIGGGVRERAGEHEEDRWNKMALCTY